MQPGRWQKTLLACGVLASLTYVATDIFVSLRYPDYSFIDQAVSELFAIGAPTGRIVIPLFTLSSALLAAFAFGVWSAGARSRALRALAIMLAANAVNTLMLWNLFPMHMRGVRPTFTDAMHLVLAINPFVLLGVVFGVVAFKGAFRTYSAVTVLALVMPAVFSLAYVAALAANQPTPGMGLAERLSQYSYQVWQAVLAVVLWREGKRVTSSASAFKSPEGEAKFLAAYDAQLRLWPVLHEQIDVPTPFGTTHVVVCGPITAPPLVLLHGYMATATMWLPNIAAFSRDYRVYAVDVMGQPGKSRPGKPIVNVADFVSWLTATVDGLHLDRVFLVGMSFGGWLALNYTVSVPQRIRKLVLLSPGGLLPMAREFTARGMLMVWLTNRFTVNSFFYWLGFGGRAYRDLLDLIYLGLKHFRMPLETARVMPAVVADEALRTIQTPTLLLIGEQEVISDPMRALERARRLIHGCEGELVSGCRHDMCSTRHDVVNARILEFLKRARTDDRMTNAARSVASSAQEECMGTAFAAVLGFTAVYWWVLRPWMNRWGATPSDVARVMAGDSLLPAPTYSGTTAVTINARPEHIWPWLVQIGYRRGGLYSYDWLDRLFGYLDRPSATRILPEFQQLTVGDRIPLGRGPSWPVGMLESNRALVLDMRNMGGLDWVWQFGLYPLDDARTRLVSRSRVRARAVWARLLTYAIEPAGFLMTRRMLLGLKERSEELRAQRV